MTLSRAIRIVRCAKDVTMASLSQSADVSAPMLSLIESGKRDPSVALLKRIAAALEVPYELFVLVIFTSAADVDDEIRSLYDAMVKVAEAEDRLRQILAGTIFDRK